MNGYNKSIEEIIVKESVDKIPDIETPNEQLLAANKELALQYEEKGKRAAELIIANKELVFQNKEKEKRAAELIIANKELLFQNDQKEKRSAELATVNKELAFQNGEKEKRAAELIIANKELAFQNEEKEKRALELLIANEELVFQNDEKGKRAAELAIANEELAFQNEEKEKRAAELTIANKELVFQNEEKEKRAAELIIANKELLFQNDEKEKRAVEKEKRAAELIIANEELLFQNEEKEKRAAELVAANKELVAFTYISSHDLQEPLRKIQSFAKFILDRENANLSDDGKDYFLRMRSAAARMQQLLEDLLAYSRISANERKYEHTDLNLIVEDVIAELREVIEEKNAIIEASDLYPATVIPFQFRQLIYNLVSNALKFSQIGIPPHIQISSTLTKGSVLHINKLQPEKLYCHIIIKDNGIGFNPEYSERIFDVFQKLHSKEEYMGTGIGLAIVKKIIDSHNGIITATGELMKGATFNIYIPTN
jgi:signal transduction histidine kinase